MGFVRSDAMFHAWRHSPSCVQLAAKTREWGFVEGMRNILGKSGQPQSWSEVVARYDADVQANEFGKSVGSELSSSLLMAFARNLGIDDTDLVKSSDAEWAIAALKKRDLEYGWVEDCETPQCRSQGNEFEHIFSEYEFEHTFTEYHFWSE